jgi:hypothetical protein
MPFNTKFTPSQYQDRDQYNESVLNESYATIKALRESYSHLYQEFTNLRNSMQDFKGEQANQPELATSEADVNRYNNELENRYMAMKSIQLNTTYPNEYGHMVKPFSENDAAEQIRLNCHYMISGSHMFKNYHLAKTSCIKLAGDITALNIRNELNTDASGVTLVAKAFYINSLDAAAPTAVFGNGTDTFDYNDEYNTTDNLDVLEGHVYRLKVDASMLGALSASVLGRNVENCEKIMEILAMNVNATEQSLDRVVEIAQLLGVELQTN